MGIFQRLGKSKSVIHSILRKLEKTGSCEAKKHLAGLGKLLQGKTDGLVMNQKIIDLHQQPLSLKELVLTLANTKAHYFPKT